MKTAKLLVGILTITAALAMQIQAQSFLTNGLVAYYPFNGNANDASGSGNNGTFQDATSTTNMFGVQDSAFYFNGSNAVVNVPDSAFNDLNEGTIATWVELDGNSQEAIFAKEHDGANSYGVFTVGSYPNNGGTPTIGTPGTLYFHAQNGAPLVASSNLLATGVWYHVAVVFSATNCNLYINGILSGEYSGNFSIPNDTSAVTSIGAWENLTGTFALLLSGRISDFRIYNLAMPSNEVAQLYAIESVPLTSPEITSQPQSTTVNGGDNASFSVTAIGTLPLSLQWQLDSVNISGATNAVYNLTDATANDAGIYTVVVSNTVGTVTSSNAILTVIIPPHAATATATLANEFVINVSITDGGYDYTNTPLVRLIGGGGSGAGAYATVSNGVVISITVTNAGYGYTNAPLVVIDPPFIPNPLVGIAAMSFLSFSNLALGGNYQLQLFTAYYWTNQPLSFKATNTLYTQMFSGLVGSGDYRLALNPVPSQAFATPQVVHGFVVGATVTSGGSGYVTSPAVTFVGRGGTNAAAISQISGGVVTGIEITDAGFGYTNTPTIEIVPPPAAAVTPTVQPVMQLNSSNLAPYDNYQIQFVPAIGGTWANWNDGFFTTTGVTNSQYLFITNGTGFFQLQFVP